MTDPQGNTVLYPSLRYRTENVSLDYINKLLGIKYASNFPGPFVRQFKSLLQMLSSFLISCPSDKIATLLTKMGLASSVTNDGKDVNVEIPPTRHDVLHACDIMEDVGIAFGYNNIKKTFPKTNTIAQQLFLNELSDDLRHELARCGFTEALTFSLVSQNHHIHMYPPHFT